MIKTLTIVFIFLGAVLSMQAQTMLNYEICSTQRLKAQDVDTLCVDLLRYLSNEIYARNGYKFSTEKYDEYFKYEPWYESLDDNSQVKLSEIEEHNVKLMTDRRKEKEQEREITLSYFKNLKDLAQQNKDSELKRIVPPFPHSEDGFMPELKKTLSYIDFNDVNWYKNNGLYSVTVDNGYVKIMYSFEITRESITLTYNYMAHSDIMERFGTIYSDYMSESEYAVWWVFAYKDNRVVFEFINMAG